MVTTAEEVYRLLRKGNEGRVSSATELNAQSSRSHTILRHVWRAGPPPPRPPR